MKRLAVFLVLEYLRFFAKLQLFKIRPVIIGVGGASGKTSLVYLLGLILKKRYKILETQGKNSETGIPLSLLGISLEGYSYFEWLKVLLKAPLNVVFNWKRYDVLIAEMGIDSPFEPKNMGYLLKIIKPKIGVLTNISWEHSQNFDSLVKGDKDRERKILDLTAKEETLLLKSIPENGTTVLNVDDPKIKETTVKSAILTVSTKDKSADFYAYKIEIDLKHFSVKFTYLGENYVLNLAKPLPIHYATTILLAVALSTKFEIKASESVKIIEEEFDLPAGRMNVFEGINKTTVIDSSYNNATITPILDFLTLLGKIAGKRRKVAIIGDMRELGSISKVNHEKVAKKILKTAGLAILIGPLMQKYTKPILAESGFPFYSFPNFSKSKNLIRKIIKKNDLILVKGSQNTLYLERIVEMLLKNSKDKELLCRRGEYWDKIRRSYL